MLVHGLRHQPTWYVPAYARGGDDGGPGGEDGGAGGDKGAGEEGGGEGGGGEGGGAGGGEGGGDGRVAVVGGCSSDDDAVGRENER